MKITGPNAEIIQYVTKHPGCYMSDIRRDTSIQKGAIASVLTNLTRVNTLRREGFEKRYRYFVVSQEARPVQGWIPCSERMPDTMISVLVTGDWFHHAVSFWDGASWCDLDFEPPVTHWMPLPAAPQQEVK